LETLSGWGEAKGAAFIITPIDLRGGRGHLFLEVAAPSALHLCYNWSATTSAYEFPNKTLALDWGVAPGVHKCRRLCLLL